MAERSAVLPGPSVFLDSSLPTGSPNAAELPILASKLAERVGEQLRQWILCGEFAPGTHLREVEIAGMLDVSRGPVREALLRLHREGLVLLRPNRGAVVARLSQTDLEEVFSLRLAIERLATTRAVQFGTESDFEAMDTVLHQFRGSAADQPLTEQEAADQDLRFHDAVYAAAHHRRLLETWMAIRSQVYVLLLGRNVATPDFREDTFTGHLELAYLIRARDGVRAAAAIEGHLAASYKRVLASYPHTRIEA